MKKILPLVCVLATVATAHGQQRHELQLTPFAWFNAPADYFIQVGYFYTYARQKSIGARVSYHARRNDEIYNYQLRFFEISHRWSFQKEGGRIFGTLSAGPWGSYFTGQHTWPDRPENRSVALGAATSVGVHYRVLPRWSVGVVGLTTLEVFQWESGKKGALFYPLFTPGVGLQMAFAW